MGYRQLASPIHHHERHTDGENAAPQATWYERLTLCKRSSNDSSSTSVVSLSTGGDNNMRYALVIAMLLGSTLLAQAEPIDRDKWIAQTGKASKPCLAKFRQKFGEDKGHNYSVCMTDQTNKAIDDCIGSSAFSNCVLEKSLRVLEVCDLSSC